MLPAFLPYAFVALKSYHTTSEKRPISTVSEFNFEGRTNPIGRESLAHYYRVEALGRGDSDSPENTDFDAPVRKSIYRFFAIVG